MQADMIIFVIPNYKYIKLDNQVNITMIKVKENSNYIIAFSIGLLAPTFLKMAANFAKQKAEDFKNKSLYSAGIQINHKGYKIIIGQPIFDKSQKVKALNVHKQYDGEFLRTPEETIKEIRAQLGRAIEEDCRYCSIGVCSVGSLELDRSHLKYGFIEKSLIEGWKDTPLLYYISKNMKVQKVIMETSANSAALAQFRLGDYSIKSSLAYVNVGVEIDVGIVQNKKPVHGLTHPKCGHLLVNRHDKDKNFIGVCEYHENCLQGMASLRSVQRRLQGRQMEKVGDSDRIWQIVGYYLAQLCYSLALTFSPEVIVFSGQVMRKGIIYEHIHRQFVKQMNSLKQKELYSSKSIKKFIVESSLGNEASRLGTILLQFV